MEEVQQLLLQLGPALFSRATLGVWGLGFRGLGFRVWGLESFGIRFRGQFPS